MAVQRRGGALTFLELMGKLDITEVFKTKGNIRRWSAKRTIGGAIVIEALYQAHTFGLEPIHVFMCMVGITPLCLSMFEK